MKKNLLVFLLGLSAFSIITVYGLITLGVFDNHKILVTTLATTGPDFELLAGKIKLSSQTPASIKNIDLSGVMIDDNGCNTLCDYLKNNYLAFGDYFVLEEKVIGVKESDGLYPHPLIKILSWKHIEKMIFWFLTFLDTALFILLVLLYKKIRFRYKSMI